VGQSFDRYSKLSPSVAECLVAVGVGHVFPISSSEIPLPLFGRVLLLLVGLGQALVAETRSGE
jgi:hypothetical protein